MPDDKPKEPKPKTTTRWWPVVPNLLTPVAIAAVLLAFIGEPDIADAIIYRMTDGALKPPADDGFPIWTWITIGAGLIFAGWVGYLVGKDNK